MVAVIALVAAHQAWSVAQGLAHCHMAFPPQVRGSGIGLESVVKRHAEGGPAQRQRQVYDVWQVLTTVAMPAGPGNFVTRLQTKAGMSLSAKVVEATVEDAQWWHANVQIPFIGVDNGVGKDERIDRAWDWPTIVVRSAVFEALATARSCAYLQLLCRREDGLGIPVGQVLLVDGYPLITRRSQESVFLWYLTGMPPKALSHFGIPADLKVLRALVDIAVQFSFLRAYRGCICLHADRHGSKPARDELVAKYKAIELQQVAWAWYRFMVSPVRRNDGRYFVADDVRALHLTAKLDSLR